MFERGRSPKDVFGITPNIKSQLEKEHSSILEETPNIEVTVDAGVIVVDINKSLVVRNLSCIEEYMKDSKVLFNPEDSLTILDELTTADIRSRIRDYYGDIINKCKGKSTTEQEDILFGKEPGGFHHPKLQEGEIDKSIPAIQRIQEHTDEIEEEELHRMLQDELEYALTAKDSNGVRISVYRDILKRNLSE